MSKFKALKEIIEGVAPAVAKEGEEAAASALAKEAEKAVAKESSEYMVPGPWQSGSYGRVTEELPIEFLQSYKGNRLRNNDLSSLKKSIQEEGLREPLILGFDPSNNKIKLVEGNHRLEALRQLGYTHAPVRGSRSHIDDVLERLLGHPHADYPKLPFKPSTDRIDPSYYPADMKPSDIIDFEALKKIKPKAIAGAGLLGGAALSPESAEASEIKQKPKSQLKDLLKNYSPSFGSKTGDYSSYDESEALPTEGMQGQGLATVIRNIIADKKPPSEFEEGGGGIYGGGVLDSDPVEYAIPALAAAKGISKAFTHPDIRKAIVSEILPNTKFEKIKQALPPSTIEGKVVIPQIPPVLDSDLTKPARDAAFKEKFNLPLTHGTTVKKLLRKELQDKGLLPEEGILGSPRSGRPTYSYYDENFKKLGEVEPSSFSVFPEFNPSNTGTFGEGVYTSPRIKSKSGNVIADTYSDLYEQSGFQIPLMARGEKIFNIPARGRSDFLTNFPELKGIVPSFDESLEKLSKVSGIPKKELEIKGKNELTELARKYPEHFEGVSYGGEVNIFDKKNIRSPWAKFDSAKKDSADYLSGLAAAGLTFDQIKQLLDKNSSDRNEF